MSEKLTIVEHPLVQDRLSRMRRVETKDAEFRRLLRETSVFLTYEATRSLPMTTEHIHTPMTEMEAPVRGGRRVAIISILRAGNGLLDGALDILPGARVGFVGLFRDEETLQPVQYYFKVPEKLSERVVLVVDPMLATGNTSVAAIKLLKEAGAKDIRFICLLAAPEGVKHMQESHPDVPIVTASVDRCLNEHGYILPGLGDAGDRMYGTVKAD